MSSQTILNLGSGKHYGDLKTWLKLSRAFKVGMDAMLSPVWDREADPGPTFRFLPREMS